MEPVMVQTPGGRIEVNWEPEASATAQAQLAFFAEFLATSGVYQEWVGTCPLHYSSNNASEVADVLGTWFLSILAGHCRYAHVTGLRGDQASRQILGMKKMVSEDALRRALARIGEQASAHWLKPRLLASAGPVLDRPWILDIDTTIKTLYGKQQGAEVSYNPHKPGRPSHTLHTYFVADLRLVLDAVVHSGKQHAAHYTLPGLVELLDGLAPHLRPALVRGDCGFGNEPVIGELEKRGQSYLFKLRQTEGVKRLLRRQFARQDWTRPGAGDQGWSAIEDTLQLTGWERARRVVILRRKARTQVALTRQTEEAQIELLLPSTDVDLWEYAVLVADCPYPLESVAQLYRDRADAENAFDELKNQWGWGGFTTRDMSRCQTAARRGPGLQLVELVLPRRKTRSPHGSRDESAAAAGRRGPIDPPRRKNPPAHDAAARPPRHADAAHRQYPSGYHPRSTNCGAVARDQPLENTAGLHCGPHPAQDNSYPPAPKPNLRASTAGFRFIARVSR